MQDILNNILSGLSRLLSQALRVLRRFTKQINHMNKYDKTTSIVVLVLLFLLLFSPILRISPSTSTTSNSHGFLLSFSFIKSFVLVIAPLLGILFLLFNKKTKVFVVEKLGFQGNYYLLIVLLLAVGLASLISLGESLKLVGAYTTTVKLTSMFYILQVIFIVLEAFALFVLLSGEKITFRGHVVSYNAHSKKNQPKNSDEGGLFDTVRHK